MGIDLYFSGPFNITEVRQISCTDNVTSRPLANVDNTSRFPRSHDDFNDTCDPPGTLRRHNWQPASA